jgi:5-methylcytosine-specific restriction endonuclease McrA
MVGINAARVEDNDSEWVRVHEALSRLARERAAADAEEGRWLLAARRSAVHIHLGFGSFGEYIERLFGYTRRTVQEKLRVAEALEELPSLAHALETGLLSWSAARELTRVAVADTEQEWLELARGKTLRQLEEVVVGKCPGDDPSAAGLPSATRHVLRFEVAPETLALFREALTALRRRSGEAWDDDSALLEMARQVLGGPQDDGRASYQIALAVCPSCGCGRQQANGELVPVAAEVVAMAQCDGQHLGFVPSRAANENGSVADAHVDATASHPDAHTITRAKQPVPPALRRAALLRDQHRCRVPGCRNATFVDLHHVELRSEGGRNQLANLVTVCGAHHRAAHRGQLVVESDAHVGVRFRHGDGTEYGHALQPQALDVSAKLFSALRGLGFREREIRSVLAELRKDNDLRDASISHLLRESLRRIQLPNIRR